MLAVSEKAIYAWVGKGAAMDAPRPFIFISGICAVRGPSTRQSCWKWKRAKPYRGFGSVDNRLDSLSAAVRGFRYLSAISSLALRTTTSTFSSIPLRPYSSEARVGSPTTPLPSNPPPGLRLSLRTC